MYVIEQSLRVICTPLLVVLSDFVTEIKQQSTIIICFHHGGNLCMYVYLFAVKTGTSMQWDQI